MKTNTLEVSSKIIINDNCDRGVLSEGRNYGMGFAFLKKTGDNKFQTIMPITACKDYLNDVVYTEHTQREVSAYGLKTSFNNLLKESHGYMVIKMLPRSDGGDYSVKNRNLAVDTKQLKDNYKNIQKFINLIAPEYKIVIRKADDDMFFIKLNKKWMSNNYAISLLTFLLRVSLYWDGVEDPLEFIKKIKNDKSDIESSIAVKCAALMERFRTDGSLKCVMDYDMINDQYLKDYPNAVHNHGIVHLKLV
jgi:hypothetical protein